MCGYVESGSALVAARPEPVAIGAAVEGARRRREKLAVFRVMASADAQVLPRLLNLFAQRDILPSELRASVTGDRLHVSFWVGGLEAAHADLIAEKMRQNVSVTHVELAPDKARMTC